MPVIRVTDETLERLKRWAEPLVDTAESALAKALDAAEQTRALPGEDHLTPAAKPSRPRRRRPTSKNKLPQREFRQPLLQLLYELGGSAQVSDLQPLMKEKMASALLPGDLQPVSTGDERWWNATCWERSNLVKEGYLRDDSPRGTWELSEQGTELVSGSRSRTPNPFVEHLLSIPAVGHDADFERERSGPRGVEL